MFFDGLVICLILWGLWWSEKFVVMLYKVCVFVNVGVLMCLFMIMCFWYCWCWWLEELSWWLLIRFVVCFVRLNVMVWMGFWSW